MSSANRTRLFAALVVFSVIPIGLFARSHRAGADPTNPIGFLATYAGDTLWPIMFYFAARFCFPAARIVSLLLFVLALTLTLEFSQLWKPPWLECLRSKPGIGFVLGSSFVWSDVVCCWAGSILAMLFDLFNYKLLSRAGDTTS